MEFLDGNIIEAPANRAMNILAKDASKEGEANCKTLSDVSILNTSI